MQIYALNHLSHLVRAPEAQKGIAYSCPECHQPVRMRGGRIRQPHFYHLSPTTQCRLSNKSMIHLEIQGALQRMLSPEEVFIEHRFPKIGRIADLVWPAQKLIFEVQVSPISAEEVRGRNRDYASCGYQVVWILHDKRFNGTHFTPAEATLRSSPHYFTNMSSSGKGFFYDQHSHIRFKRRTQRTPRYSVRFKKITPVDPKQLPRHFPTPRKSWPLSFDGDLFHRPYSWDKPEPTFNLIVFLKRLYRTLHHLMLEKTTY